MLDQDAGLAERLWAARETAESVKAGEGRTRVSLYRAISLAYDFAIAAEASPSRQLAAQDLLEEVRRRLTSEERQLLELRDQGLDWAEIAAARNGSPEALRKRLARAIDRVSAQLGLEDYRDE